MKSSSGLCGLLESRRKQALSLAASFAEAQRLADLSASGGAQYLLLRKVSQDLLLQSDQEGSQEPSYHSRQHVADAVLSMGYFLQETRFNDYQKQLLLLVMLVHDFGHRGIANKLVELSHEEESIDLLKATALMSLPSEDINFVWQCIMGTQPQNVLKVSDEYLQNPDDPFALMRALVNDADIAASFVPSLGLELSKQILLERGVKNPSDEDAREALLAFKSHAPISTPVARKALGIMES